MKTSYSYYTGGRGADMGLEAAGYTSLGGVEYDAQIAAVAAQNGHKLTVADVRTVDPAALLTTAPDWFHASPVCKSFSQAKTNGKELESDIEMAQATARFIRYWLPATVSIENVWQYRDSASFKCITDCLTECGYSYEYWHLNAADYGVPQTRKRLILIARRGLWYIQRPSATHQEIGDLFSPAWIGWYEAIEDLIPTLPESRFADWQLKRLPAELCGSLLFGNNDPEWGDPYKWDAAPAMSITTQTGSRARAFIVSSGSDGWRDSVPTRNADEPMITVTTNAVGRARAFIVDGQTNAHGESSSIRRGDDPMYTLSASMEKRPARAFLAPNTTESDVRYADEPAHTTTSSDYKNMRRAFLVHSTDMRSMPVRDEGEPAFTVLAHSFDASHAPVGKPRAWLQSGRVVSMTPRALARFQSFPDSYLLPSKAGLACTVIGNAVCPLLMQRVAESVTQ